MEREMECAAADRLLEPFLAGELNRGEREALDRHLAACDACRAMFAVAEAGDDGVDASPPADLLAGVLARTSGPACELARRLVAPAIDGELSAEERRLLSAHLGGCADCRRLSEAVERLGEDLPLLAETHPGPGFVDRVMRATLPLAARWRRWWRRTWPAWIARPRFAWEAAWAGTLVLVLLFATPFSPLAAMPPRALELARSVPAARLEAPLGELGERIVDPAREARRETGSTLAALGEEVDARVDALADATWSEGRRQARRVEAALRTLARRAASSLSRGDESRADEEPREETTEEPSRGSEPRDEKETP